MAYDVSNPAALSCVTYINTRTADSGDCGPDYLVVVISAANSSNGKSLLVAGNKTTGSTAIHEISQTSMLLRPRLHAVIYGKWQGAGKPVFQYKTGFSICAKSGLTKVSRPISHVAIEEWRMVGCHSLWASLRPGNENVFSTVRNS